MATVSLVTGATGYIGSRVVRALVERGDDVRITVRGANSRTPALAGLDVQRMTAEVTDRRALRRAMKGVQRVFHVAGVATLRMPEGETFRVNVGGTRAVLGEALRAGVERVVHTSSFAAVGPAPWGTTADETQAFPPRGLGIPAVDSKYAAEVEALRAAARGLDLVMVCPGHVLGAGDDRRSSTDVVRRFLLRRIPVYVDGAICVVDVADVAAGMLLADERGKAGERYLLGTRNYTWDRLFADVGRLSGVEPPALRLPVPLAAAAARSGEPVFGRHFPTADEVRAAGQWWAYRSAKARRELGWTSRPHEDTVEETVAWHAEREAPRLARQSRRQSTGWRVGGWVASRTGIGR